MRKIGILLIISLILFPNIILAKEYSGQIKKGSKIEGIYIKKEKGDKSRREYGQFLYRSTDKKYVYCLEPWAKINNDNPYQEATGDYHLILNLSKEDFQKIEWYAYYGYQYKNHTDDKWYVITQKKIWQVVDKKMDIYFTDKLIDGNRINPYQKEEDELEKLVQDHLKKPSFDNKTYTVNLNDDLTITDTNQVLSTFDNQNSNTINLKNITEDKTFTFKKEDTKYSTPSVVYYQENSQNVFILGKPENINTSFKVHVTKGKIKLIKEDTDTKEKLQDVVFEIYQDNNLITTLTTDEKGEAITTFLPLGDYTIKEVKTKDGYILDTKEYQVSLKDDNKVETLTLYNKKIPVITKTVTKTVVKTLPKTTSSSSFVFLTPILFILGMKKKYEI